MPFRTVVTFRSESFNATVVRPYFVSVNSFGDDAAQHIVYELQRHGIQTGDPGQEDFGWYFRFEVEGKAHLFVLGYRPVEGDWLGNIERVPILMVKPRVHPHAPTNRSFTTYAGTLPLSSTAARKRMEQRSLRRWLRGGTLPPLPAVWD